MAWIRVIDPDTTDPKTRLARLYRGSTDPGRDRPDNIITIHSLRPDTLDGHLKLYGATMHPRHGDGLSRREREVLAVAVSAVNECHY
jgi:alkylhydroperoxidase family enzyme